MSQEDQLKQACQYMINATLQNRSIKGKSIFRYDEKSSFDQIPHLMINLEQQSESFGLFVCDQSNHRHWIAMLLNHLNQERQSTSPKQLLNCLLQEDLSPTSKMVSEEQIKVQKSIKLRQIVFYEETPSFALMFITFQYINEHEVIFIARNFYRQVVYLSINQNNIKKYDIIFEFSSEFYSPFLFIFDSIDHGSFLDTDLTKQQFKTLAKTMHFVYFKVKSSIKSFLSLERKAPYYEEMANSLFSQEYNKEETLSFTEVQKNKIRQSFQQYHQVIVQQESELFKTIKSDPIVVIKEILKINFFRKIPKRLNKQRGFIKFQDFIRAQNRIYQEMESTIDSLKDKHEKQPLGTISSCLNCSQEGRLHSQASQKCYACSILKKKPISLCDKCFWSYHVKKRLLIGIFDQKTFLSRIPNPQSPLQHPSESIQMNDASILLRQKSNDMIKMEQKEKPKPKEFVEEKLPQLSEQKKQKVKKLQDSASKLIEMMSKIRDPERFYKPKHPNASNEKQFQSELKNQQQFMKIIDYTIKKELETFQNQVFIKIRSPNQFQKTSTQFKSDKNSNKNGSNEKEKAQKREEKMDIELSGCEQQEINEISQN